MSELTTRPLDPLADGQDLIQLFEDVFGQTILPYMWQWKYVPPWAQRFHCWVGRVDGKAIGYAGAVPLRGQIDGTPVPFFQLADFMVHPDYRMQHDFFQPCAQHIFDDIVKHHPKHLLYGFSSHRAFLWFKKMGWSDLVEKAMTRYVRAGVAEGAAGRFEFRDWEYGAPELDELWSALGPEHRVSLIRDAQYLKWRYGGHPINNYRLMGVFESGKARGWVLIGNDGAGVQGRPPEVPVVDLLLPEECIRPVLTELVDHVSNPVMAWLPQHIAADFDEQQETKTNVFHHTDRSFVETSFLQDHLYYTMGDVDWW